MTDESRPESDDAGQSRQRWTKELQDALDKTGEAVRTAWEATRDSRMGALESAKQAAKELGDVLEKGVEAARGKWEEGKGVDASPGTPPGDTTVPPPPPTTPEEDTPPDQPPQP